MENIQQQLDNLSDIKQLMEKSSRFISLSGLSGVFIGLIALIGSVFVYFQFNALFPSLENASIHSSSDMDVELLNTFIFKTISTAIIVLFSSLGLGVIFTIRKAKKNELKIWDNSTKRLLFHLFIPLQTGAVFMVALFTNELFALLAPASLIFYGLALVNASTFTFKDIKFLGLFDVCLGLLALFFLNYSLIFWAIGFGLMHIVYGVLMYFKYEK